MNRRERRALRRDPGKARRAARLLASSFHYLGPHHGQAVPPGPAQEALTRAFARLLVNGSSYELVRMTDEEAHAFPSCPAHAKVPGWGHWLAVTRDPQGQGCFTTQAERPDPDGPAPTIAQRRAYMASVMLPKLAAAREADPPSPCP